MTVKKIISKLQLLMKQKFPHYDGKFYANHRNTYIHLELDKSLFSFGDYKDFLNTIDEFLTLVTPDWPSSLVFCPVYLKW